MTQHESTPAPGLVPLARNDLNLFHGEAPHHASATKLRQTPCGFFLEPYTRNADDSDGYLSVVCVERRRARLDGRTALVRHMPVSVWEELRRAALAVESGLPGMTSQHLLLPPSITTLPTPKDAGRLAAVAQETDLFALRQEVAARAAVEGAAAVTRSRAPQRRPPQKPKKSLSLSSQALTSEEEDRGGDVAAAHDDDEDPSARSLGSLVEPVVFDHVVAPASRVAAIRALKHSSRVGYLRHKLLVSDDEMRRIEMEDRRALLAAERRDVFLRQLQRDHTARADGRFLYVVAEAVPFEKQQLFILALENLGTESGRRAEAELAATPASRTTSSLRSSRRGAVSRSTSGLQREPTRPNERQGSRLFTMQDLLLWGGSSLFPPRMAVDGYVMVSVSDVPIADGGVALAAAPEETFEPHDYGSAAYAPRIPRSRKSV